MDISGCSNLDLGRQWFSDSEPTNEQKHLILALILLWIVSHLGGLELGMITSPALSLPSMHLVVDGSFAGIAI